MKKRKKMQVIAGFSLSSLLTQFSLGQESYDVFFLSDTTGSMGGLINSAQNSSSAIFSSFQSRGDVRFGVGEYRDGNAGSFDFRYNLTTDGAPVLSNDSASVSAAIGEWAPSGGGDFAEDNLAGLQRVAAQTPWRKGSRRMIFWFGDAPGNDPASDNATLSTTLAALSSECVQVIAIDLSSLDSTGQATTIVNETLSCGLGGGLLEDASALSEAELDSEIDSILLSLFDEIVTGGGSTIAFESSSRLVGISMSRTMTRNVGGRLSHLRAGGSGSLDFTTTSVASPNPKGGLAMDSKGGLTPASNVEAAHRWHVWGDVYAMTEEFDGQLRATGAVGTPDVDLDIYGGTVGVDYRLDQNWTLGIGFGAASGEADLNGLGDIDIDSFAIMPYVSFYKANAVGQADLYADLMYSYTDSTYDFGVGGDVDGEAHQIELNVGLNYGRGGWVHGPFAQVRYLDGEIDNGPDFESFATQIGYQVSKAISINGGTLVPQASLAWEHEFEADQGSIGGLNLGELDEDLLVGGLGLQFLSDTNWHVGVNYQARLGDDTESHYVGLNAGFRF